MAMVIAFKSRPALVAYVTCGDPDLRSTREVALAAIDAGAEVIELGVPFSDPVADGPVIQRASERALKNGVSLDQVLTLAAEIRRESDAGLIVFSYFNPVLRMGLEKFAARAADVGVDGALITDLPVEEAGEYLGHMRAHNLATIFLAAPCGFADGSHGYAKGIAGRCAETGAAAAKVYQVADCGWLRNLGGGAVCCGRQVRRCRGGGQRDCAGDRAQSGHGSASCGRIHKAAFRRQPSAISRQPSGFRRAVGLVRRCREACEGCRLTNWFP